MIATLILAAGASSRMGGVDKLLELVEGQPLLARMAQRAAAIGETFVCVPRVDHPRCAVLPTSALIVPVADPSNGMSQSLRAGIAALPDRCRAVMVLPADMPDISTDDLRTLIAHYQATNAPIVRATTDDGRPGHPILFDCSLFREFEALTGDRGAFQICSNHAEQTVFVPLNGNRARLDLDTPEDWDRYRAR